jgi:hypothetical protein
MQVNPARIQAERRRLHRLFAAGIMRPRTDLVRRRA